MIKNFTFFLICSFFSLIYGQVGVGTNTPNPSAMLDITSNDKGLLMPRVALIDSNDTTTIANGNILGLIIFNTATQNDVTPGFYYWDNVKWVRVSTASPITNEDYQVVYSAIDGQNQFNTPLAFSNPNKINVFRNGVRIGFTQISPSVIELEAGVICNANDEIRILQNN